MMLLRFLRPFTFNSEEQGLPEINDSANLGRMQTQFELIDSNWRLGRDLIYAFVYSISN